jgi:predicted XRE-type DNA-binding protein
MAKSRRAKLTGKEWHETKGNIFLDLGFTPEEAENLLLRSQLMLHLRELVRRRKLTQSQAAKLFHVTQPRVSDLMRGQINLFSIDALIAMLSHAGIGTKLSFKPKAA